VGRAVDIEDVSAPLTGRGESGLDLDVIIAGSPDCIQGAPQHLAHAGQPEELPAKSPPQAKIVKKKPLRFQFLYTNINFNLKSTQFELSKTRILSNTHMHTHIHVRTHSCHKHKHED